jgi:hypothetical protein
MVSMDIPWIVAAAVFGLWLIATLFHLGELSAAWYAMLAAQERSASSRFRRPGELFWVLPAVSVIALATALAVDWAGRVIFDAGRPLVGTLMLLGIAVVLVTLSLCLLAGLRQRQPLTYARLRQSVSDAKATRPAKADIAAFKAQLAQLDDRHGAIRLGPTESRALTGIRRRLEQTARVLASGTGMTAGVVRSVPWRFAAALLGRGSRWRLVPVAIGVAAFVAAVVAAAVTGTGVALAVASILVPCLSYLVALVSARVSLASKVAWHAVCLRQRADAASDLHELERRTSRGVPGLSDRVARALRILREQQS